MSGVLVLHSVHRSPSNRPLYILPFRAVVWGIVGVFLVGLVGGVVGSWLTVRRIVRVTASGERVIERVERVTVAAEDALASAASTVSASTGVLLDDRDRVQGNVLALTQDGVFVGSGPVPTGTLRVLGPSSETLAASVVRVYPEAGVFFLKVAQTTVPVPNIERGVPLLPGTALAAVSRAGDGSLQVRIAHVESERFLTDRAAEYVGLARVPWRSSSLPASFQGAPLVGTDGRVRGVVAGAQTFFLDGALLDLLLQDYLGYAEGTSVETLSGIQGTWVRDVQGGESRLAFRLTEIDVGGTFATAGFRVGDEILTVDGKPFTGSGALIGPLLSGARGQRSLTFSVQRGSETVSVLLTPSVS